MNFTVLFAATFLLPSGSVSELEPGFHGKEIQFSRRISLPKGKYFQYLHKGMVFVPSKYEGEAIFQDSEGEPIDRKQTYIIHLWYPGNSIKKTRVRLDRLSRVIEGDDFAIVADSPGALPTEVAIARGISAVGHHHRGVGYNVLGNNCGHFVAWCKYGKSQHDTQVRDMLDTYSKKFDLPNKEILVRGISNLVQSGYQDHPPALTASERRSS